jgi:hypothetical protein
MILGLATKDNMANAHQTLSTKSIPNSPLIDPEGFRIWLDAMKKNRSPKITASWADNITYDLNDQGYRCGAFEGTSGLKLLSVGCSFVFGTAIPYEDTFSYQLARALELEIGRPTVNWNLSCPARSSDYVARMISTCVPSLQPDLVVINFPVITRREFFADTGRILGFTPNLPDKVVRDFLPPEALDIHKAFSSLISLPNDIRNFILNFRLCEAVLERCGIPWCYGTRHEQDAQYIAEIEGDENFIGELLVSDRQAADAAHPGPDANKDFSEAIMLHLRKTGKLDLLKA